MDYFLIFLFGLVIGSFLNVVICRLETEESMLFGRSRCPFCGGVLGWRNLIPVLSFIFQKGRCTCCGKKISKQYIFVELLTGLLFLALFFTRYQGFDLEGLLSLVYLLVITSFLVVIFVYDFKYLIIPDKIVFPAIVVSLLWILISELMFVSGGGLLSTVFSALGAGAFFISLVLITGGKGMGLGDVKLAFLMGLVLGWPEIFFALFLAVFSGALYGIFLILIGKKGLKSEIPFGPFLAGSTMLFLILNESLSLFDVLGLGFY